MDKIFEKKIINSYLNWITDLLFLFIAIGIFYMAWLGSHPLMVPDEGRYADIGRAMLISGDYITPCLNGVTYLDKPILHYWLQASAMKLLGINEWAIRAWPALLGVLGCLLTYSAGRLLYNRRTGILAAAMLATSPLYFCMSHYANLDLEVGVFISGALLAFIVWARDPTLKYRTAYILSAYGFTGLAILTKGLIGLAFPAMIIGCWIFFLNRWKTLLQMRLISGILIMAFIVLPWCILSQLKDSSFFQHFFIDEQIYRFLTKNFNNQQPVWFYFPVVLIGLFPWLVWLLQAVTHATKAVNLSKQKHDTELFLLLWPLLIFIFFTIPQSKTIGYMIPLIPPLVLLIARYLDKIAGAQNKVSKIFCYLLVIITVAELTFIAIAPALKLRSSKSFAIVIKQIGKPDDQVVGYYRYYYDLPVYLNRQISVVENWDNPAVVTDDNWRREISNKMHAPSARQWLITENIFWKQWHSQQRMFVVLEKNDLQQFLSRANHRFYFITEYQDTYLLTNRPYAKN